MFNVYLAMHPTVLASQLQTVVVVLETHTMPLPVHAVLSSLNPFEHVG